MTLALAPDLSDVDRALLSDPQTSGGLLVACAPGQAGQVLEIFTQDGFGRAAVIGQLVPGAGLTVR